MKKQVTFWKVKWVLMKTDETYDSLWRWLSGCAANFSPRREDCSPGGIYDNWVSAFRQIRDFMNSHVLAQNNFYAKVAYSGWHILILFRNRDKEFRERLKVLHCWFWSFWNRTWAKEWRWPLEARKARKGMIPQNLQKETTLMISCLQP